MHTVEPDFQQYLEPGPYIDYDHLLVAAKARELAAGCDDAKQIISQCYHFVRDEIKHSWDAQDKRVTAKASQVMQEGVGICWAKANLLAALLRLNGIAAGICYQRLTLGDTPESGYCLHALNAVYLSDSGKWLRLDARGNKEGVEAQLDFRQERLAFPIRPHYGEIDYPGIYAQPVAKTIAVLESSDDALYMCRHSLPEEL
jgi:transglutaminase-like putative cysteine protease